MSEITAPPTPPVRGPSAAPGRRAVFFDPDRGVVPGAGGAARRPDGGSGVLGAAGTDGVATIAWWRTRRRCGPGRF